MDIKSKKYKYSAWFKLLAVVLCVLGMLSLAYGLLQAPYFEDAIQNKEFKDSMTGRDLLLQPLSDVSIIAFIYKNEEHIKTGGAVNPDDITSLTSNLNQERENEIQRIEDLFYDSISRYQSYISEDYFVYPDVATPKDPDIVTDIKNKDVEDKINQLVSKKENDIKAINEKYDSLVTSIEKQLVDEQLAHYLKIKKSLEANTDIYYYVVQGEKTIFSNLPYDGKDFFSSLPFSKKFDSKDINTHLGYGLYITYMKGPTVLQSNSIPSESQVFIGISKDRYQKELAAFNKNSELGMTGVKFASAGIAAFLSGLFYLIYSAGRRPDKDGVQLIAVDIIFLDIALAVSAGAIALCIFPIVEFIPYFYKDTLNYNITLIYSIFGVIIAIGTLIGILFVTMFIKRFKRHEVIRHTLIYRVLRWIFKKIGKFLFWFKSSFVNVFDRSPLVIRLVASFGVYSLLVLLSVLMLIWGRELAILIGFIGLLGVNFIAIFYLLRNFKTFTDIRLGAERIRRGELSFNLPEQGIAEFRALAGTINQIADGLKYAVSSQVKAERMKAELITNVSHDLKTPLTSIITYVDLLKNEGLQSDNAAKYLEIIDTKSQRLKALTEDLFEAAKANSGNISVNLENINVEALVSQGLGELSDKIEASGLTIKTSFPSDKACVYADGKLLWRVMENLLSNVFKYALSGSRVYLDVIEAGGNVQIILKNISAYELNVDPEELMERFKRGDTSRHSEGSGLGLSIAKSLTELQGGSFSINIDGDLFKAVIELPKSQLLQLESR